MKAAESARRAKPTLSRDIERNQPISNLSEKRVG
jgi:hypothetical protein